MKRTVALAVILSVSLPVFAQMGGMHRGGGTQPGMPGSQPAMGMGRQIVVAPDGMVFVVRPTAAATTPAGFELVAVRPSGVQAWTASLGQGMPALTPAGDLLVASVAAVPAMGSGPASAQKSKLTAFSILTGAPVWNLELDGMAMTLEPAAGSIYVVLARNGAGSAARRTVASRTAMERTLVCIGSDGVIRWTLPVD